MLFKPRLNTETTEDILADINGGSAVSKSSFYPPPESPLKNIPPRIMTPRVQDRDEFDLLGTGHITTYTSSIDNKNQNHADHDDILGDLAKPISKFSHFQARDDLPPAFAKPRPRAPSTDSSSDSDEDMRKAKAQSLLTSPGGVGFGTKHGKERESTDPRAPFIRQIVEMGFTPAQAKVALANTDTGLDVNAAMELLLSLQGGAIDAPRKEAAVTRTTSQTQTEVDWVDQSYAVASKTLATANKWITNKSALARRKLAEYSEATSPSTEVRDERPKWMRDAERHERREKGKGKAKSEEDGEVREEGLPMHPAERKRLEMNGVLPLSARRDSVESSKSGKSLASMLSLPDIGWIAQKPADTARKFKNDDDAVVMSSRRRRPAPPVEENLYETSKTVTSPVEEDLFGTTSVPKTNIASGKSRSEPTSQVQRNSARAGDKDMSNGTADELDLFGHSMLGNKGKGRALPENTSGPKGKGKARESHSSTMTADLRSSRPLRRELPYLDAGLLASSSQNRTRGSEAYKRGDFAKALGYYDTALTDIPRSHPIRILSLSNRALANIQIGASKPALTDCEEALGIIGPAYGVHEVIDDAGRELPMTQLWSKLMSRKATALEMQEKTQEALTVWQELVRSGFSDTAAMESRQRCEQMLAPKVKPVAKASTAPSQASVAAVKKLRAENAKQASSEAEKHSLYESVNGRLSAWSTGKDQNIRSLLSSLPSVLPPTILTTWKPVTLADLITTGKVKVTYMKALSKVHPDKISRTASVEEKMIAAGVFATLNGAWDSFKTQNNL